MPPVKSVKLVNRGAAGLLESLTPEQREALAKAAGPLPAGSDVPYRNKKNDIPKELAHLIVPIDFLIPDPHNARTHGEENMAAIRESLRRHGQTIPVVYNKKTRVVLAGNGRLQAAKDLGWDKIAAAPKDWTAGQSADYALMDNRTAELAGWDFDNVKLAMQIASDEGYVAEGWGPDVPFVLRLSEDFEWPEELLRVGPRVFSDEQIIEAAFRHFRATGFPYKNLPLHASMQEINALAAARNSELLNTVRGYGVADTYHSHRFHGKVEWRRSPLETYQDDKEFKEAIRKTLEMSGKVGSRSVQGLSFSRGTGACSNFRPGYALHLYRRFAPKNAVVLDTSTGYGGRLVGFMASSLKKYIGIDPNTDTHKANLRMAKDLGFSDKVELYNLPAEDVPAKKLAGRCDFAFTSPPYFSKETYSEEKTQSCARYKTGESWKAGFLLPTLKLQFSSLKKGSLNIINIDDVEIGSIKYPLVEWTIQCAKEVGFYHQGTESYRLPTMMGEGDRGKLGEEPVLIFKKK